MSVAVRKVPWFKRIFGWQFVVGVGPGSTFSMLALRPHEPLRAIAVGFSVSILSYIIVLLNTIVHECGHVVAGLAAGFKFKSIQIGCRVLSATSSGLKWSVSPDPIPKALTLMTQQRVNPSRSEYCLYIVGGPVATFCLGIACFKLLPPFGFAQPRNDGTIIELSVGTLCACISCLFMVSSLWPSKGAEYGSDGLQLFRLFAPLPKDPRTEALQSLAGKIENGVLSRDWPVDTMESLLDPKDGSFDEARGRFLRYLWLADLGKASASWNELNRAEAVCRSVGDQAQNLLTSILIEKTFAAAWLLRDQPLAKSLAQLAAPIDDVQTVTQARAMAALAILEAKPDEALAHLAESRKGEAKLNVRLRIKPGSVSLWLDQMEGAAKDLLAASATQNRL